jgi:hypothetical protein
MPEEDMLTMLAITLNGSEDQEPFYPDVDDFSELEVGAIVFVTVMLVKPGEDGESKSFALPGVVFTAEGGLSIRPLSTKLWDQGWTEIKSVLAKDVLQLRFCSVVKELGDVDDRLISDHYEDEIGEVIESCGEKLLKEPAFKQWMGGAIKSAKFKTERWKFLRAVAERMATTLSVSGWKKHRPDVSAEPGINQDGARWFETEFINPVLNDKTSEMSVETDKSKFKADVTPNTPTTVKYLTMLMDIMVSDEGPSPSVGKDGSPSIKNRKTSELTNLTAQVKELKETVATLTGSINAIATHLQVRAVTDGSKPGDVEADIEPEPEPEPKTVIIAVAGDAHECAYHVMSVAKAINDGATQPAEAPTFSDDAVDAARLALTLRAKKANEADPKMFEATLGFSVEELYQQVISAKQDEKTWPGEFHFVLHAAEHPEVELKIKTFREGKMATTSTRQEGLPPAKLVMFTYWRPGHFDILGIQGVGLVKLAFTAAEAAAAELTIDKHLRGDKEPMSKLSEDEFKIAVQTALAVNRVQPIPKPKVKAVSSKSKAVSWSSALESTMVIPSASSAVSANDLQTATASSLASFAHEKEMQRLRELMMAGSKQMQAQSLLDTQAHRQVAALEAKLQGDGDVRAAKAASLASFAQEEELKQLRNQVEAQSKQMQAQAQLGLQARQQVTALEVRLQQDGSATAVTPKPQQQQAPTGPQHGQAAQLAAAQAGALDMILNGSMGGKPTAQTALVIWSNSNKKKIEQALLKLDADAFKPVQSIVKLDNDTPNARHIIRAFAHDVPTVQQLLVPLLAAGLRVELQDVSPNPSGSPRSWTQVAAGGGKGKSVSLAKQAKAGLTNAISKAGTANPKRVHTQCDYYTASLPCHRGNKCWFACYNGPAKP